jgi:hypothetical protein
MWIGAGENSHSPVPGWVSIARPVDIHTPERFNLTLRYQFGPTLDRELAQRRQTDFFQQFRAARIGPPKGIPFD